MSAAFYLLASNSNLKKISKNWVDRDFLQMDICEIILCLVAEFSHNRRIKSLKMGRTVF